MKILKKFKITDYIFAVILIILIGKQLPNIIQNYKKEGTSVSNITLQLLNNQTIDITNISGPKILIFWATWCPPCKIELMRFNEAISSRELPKDKIFFVNMNESHKVIARFLKENNYNFNVVIDKNSVLANTFHVKVTPTVIQLDEDNMINNISTGISPLGIYKAMWLLR